MLKKNIGLILILVFVVGFAILMLNQQRTDAIIAKYELNLEDKQDLINRLENGEFEDGLRASISDAHVYIYHEDKTYEVNIEDEELYVSFAPYIDVTHECYMHSLTGCRGELINKEIRVRVFDAEEQLIIDDLYSTGHDGFIGMFLTKGQAYRVEVSYDDLTSVFLIDENTNQTCYTEVQLG